MKNLFKTLLLMSCTLFSNYDSQAQKTPLGEVSYSSNCCLPCEDNIIRNGGFTQGDGVVTSNITNSTFANWQIAFSSPNGNIINTGYLDNGRVNMWGNKFVGEGIKQQLTTSIKSGRSYRVSFAIKANQVNKRPSYLRYKVCAANGTTNYSCTSGSVSMIGASPDIYVVEGWKYVTLPIWTANRNYTHIYISPENNFNVNDGEKTSAGLIDNICVQEVEIRRRPDAGVEYDK